MKRKQTLVIIDIQPPFSPGRLPVGSMDAAAVEAMARLVGVAYEPISPSATPSRAWPGQPLPVVWLDHVKPWDAAAEMRSAVEAARDSGVPIVLAGLAPPCRSFAIDQSTRTALDGVVLTVRDCTKD